MTRILALHTLLLLQFALAGQAMAAEKSSDWQTILDQARGQTVDWYMWGGSPAVNGYVNGYVAKKVKELFDIHLRQVPVQDIAEVVSKLLVEKQAGKNSDGSVDLMWINGENFRTCKREQLLHGPFARLLPNHRLVDWSKPSVANDFGTPVDYMESPWGSAQVVMIYDTARIAEPPATLLSLLDWVRSNPGRFTYPAPPDFTGSVFIRHLFYAVSGSVDQWQDAYSQEELDAAADATFTLLNEINPLLWRKGATYPDSPVRMDTLFADGEIDFTFSYHQAAASRAIAEGLFPDTVRSYVFEEGTIANTHFLAIPFNAADTSAAMVVADFLLSPEAQLAKADPDQWGDFPVLDPAKLPPEWRQRFADRPRGAATLSDTELQRHQLPEPPSQILLHLEQGWQEKVLKGH